MTETDNPNKCNTSFYLSNSIGNIYNLWDSYADGLAFYTSDSNTFYHNNIFINTFLLLTFSHFIYLPPFYTFFNVSLFLSTARLPLLSCLLIRFLIYWDRQFRSFFCLSLFTDTMTLTPVITSSHLPHKDTDRHTHTHICPHFSPYIPLIPCSLPFPKFYKISPCLL